MSTRGTEDEVRDLDVPAVTESVIGLLDSSSTADDGYPVFSKSKDMKHFRSSFTRMWYTLVSMAVEHGLMFSGEGDLFEVIFGWVNTVSRCVVC